MRTFERLRSYRRASVLCFALFVAAFVFSSFIGSGRGQDFDLDEFDEEPAAAAAPAAGDGGAAGADAGAAAPASGGSGEEEAPKSENYLVWMYRSLGWFFTIVFTLLSLSMVALIVINIVALQRSALAPDQLVDDFGALLDQNRFQEAYEMAKDDQSLLGKSLSVGLARMSQGYDKATQGMQDVMQEETMRLEHQLGYLALIGNLAPMIGLFGTVVGMIASFQAIASGGAAPSPQKLAEGIATALFTTELGLAIALPALAAFDILKNRLSRLALDVAVVSDNFMGRFSNVGAGKP